MKQIKVRIKGTAPLLLNRFNKRNDDEAKKKDKEYDSTTEANTVNYFDETIGCYVPSTQLEASMREAAKNFKKGKGNYKPIILSSVFVEPDKVPLNKRIYDEIDSRFARIQRQGIIKSRPRYNDWELSFNITYDENRVTAATLRSILDEAGQIKAIGDYRPKFGRFKVEEFEEIV
jgi:hypothetical protein